MREAVRSTGRVALLVAVATVSPPVAAELAVFVDGRTMRVDDAVAVGDRIVLTLPGGGTLEVPALRVARIVADEIGPPSEPVPEELPSCDVGWTPEELPLGTPFREQIAAAARAADLHPWLLAALVQAESAFRPDAISRAGAVGLTQLMPAAAADRGVRDRGDPADNLRGGAEHLREQLDRFGALDLALAAYNAGAATVERCGGIPPYRETRGYVARVMRTFCPRDSGPGVGPSGGG